jgi:hypothetical protein
MSALTTAGAGVGRSLQTTQSSSANDEKSILAELQELATLAPK